MENGPLDQHSILHDPVRIFNYSAQKFYNLNLFFIIFLLNFYNVNSRQVILADLDN